MPLQFASPVWIHDDNVDLDYHVQRVRLPAPGTLAQLEQCAGRLHSELMDRSRPLWRAYVIEGLHSGQLGYYIKAHHAALDGQAGVLLARALFDLTPRPRRAVPAAQRRRRGREARHGRACRGGAQARRRTVHQASAPPPRCRTNPGWHVRHERAARGGRVGQNFAFGPHTPLNVPITAERGFAGLSLPLDELKRLAAVHEAKLNDIVLALCSGALRRYLAHHGGIPKKPLTAAMPISLREAGNTEYTTQATMPLVNLQSHIADPLPRLRAIRDAAGAVKAMVRSAKASCRPTSRRSARHGCCRDSPRCTSARRRPAYPPLANVVVSNVPGPQVPLYAAGARMSTYWPMSIVEHGVGLNITVMSYAGAMGFGFTTARCAVADAHQLSHALAAAFDELVAKSRNVKPGRTAAGR